MGFETFKIIGLRLMVRALVLQGGAWVGGVVSYVGFRIRMLHQI